MAIAKIIIAASGTGGHLFPGLYLARELKRIAPQANILFIGSGRPLEERIIDRNGFAREVVSLVGIRRRGVKGLFEFLGKLPGAWLRVWSIFTMFRPELVIGVGGYSSVLPVLIARLRRIPSWVHEAEPRPGLANRFLAYVANKISISYRDTPMPCAGKTVFTGHPVRPEIVAVSRELGKGEEVRKLLVMGGSQGSDAIDRAVLALAPFLRERGVTLYHQCREENRDLLAQSYRECGLEARVEPFIEALPEAYQWCHLIISRAGAGALMEIGIINRPAILVPFPAKGIHQEENARILEREGKALVVLEGEQFHERLRSALEKLLNLESYREIQNRPYSQRKTEAAREIIAAAIRLAAVRQA